MKLAPLNQLRPQNALQIIPTNPSALIPAIEFIGPGATGAPNSAPPPFGSNNSAVRGRARDDHQYQPSRNSAGLAHPSSNRDRGGGAPGRLSYSGDSEGFPSGGSGNEGDYPSSGGPRNNLNPFDNHSNWPS